MSLRIFQLGAFAKASEVLERVQASTSLADITKNLGRLREILGKVKRDSYAYGRGEKYDIELGNNLSHILSSEFALLATPVTVPLFVDRYKRKVLKQYRRRERIAKGHGDIVFCLDESGSTKGEKAAWGKAVALVMLKLAADGGRKFALVHFSGKSTFKTDMFLPGKYTAMDMLDAAETFLNGGTDYETPLVEALRLIEQDGFENADIVFTTDGECHLPDGFAERFSERKRTNRFTVTGILLDTEESFEFSLTPFCDVVYRTSELSGDDIAARLMVDRA